MVGVRQAERANPAGLDAFLQALGAVESGNNYDAVGPYTGSTYGRARGRWQIMEKIYPSWAREAGVDPGDFSPQAQERVARYKMSQYYARYGSWDLVAVAWFAGPGRADKAKKQGISSVGGIKDVLGTSVSGYVQKVLGGMQGVDTSAPSPRTAPANPRQADLAQSTAPQRPRAQSWLTEGAEMGRGQAYISPIDAQPGTTLSPVQQQTRDDQINADSLGSIMATISEAAKGGGGRVLDARQFLGLPATQQQPLVEGIPDPTMNEAPQPSQAQPENPRQADGAMAPPPKHDGFEPLQDNAKTGAQRLMASFPGLTFTSGYRDPKRNAAAGGVKTSKHLTGEATDFDGSESEMAAAAKWALANGARKAFVHGDGDGQGRHLHIEWA